MQYIIIYYMKFLFFIKKFFEKKIQLYNYSKKYKKKPFYLLKLFTSFIKICCYIFIYIFQNLNIQNFKL